MLDKFSEVLDKANMREKIFTLTAYFNVLYFFEIINLMLILLITYGNFISVSSGVILTVLLSMHIIRIYFNKGNSRMIQLFIMDIHIAVSVPFFINLFINNINDTLMDYFFTLLRIMILFCEVLLIYFLTDEGYVEENNPAGIIE